MSKTAKTIIICSIGSALEWYDFALFGFLSLILAKNFFPTNDATNSIMLLFATFASGFLMRPIGAIYFGWLGDKYGRKSALSITIILMAISTTMVGIIPTYEHIGIFSPLLITTMRLIQGFSASGEYPNAISLITEIASQKNRGFLSSFSVAGVVGGMFLASMIILAFTTLMGNEFALWGWRIPFLLSIPLGLVGYYLRYRMQESPVFEQLLNQKKLSSSPIVEVINKHFKQTLRIFYIFLFSTISFYIVFIYLSTYISAKRNLSLQFVSWLNASNIGIFLLFIPIFGKLSDKIDKNKIMRCGTIGIILFAYPLFMIANNCDFKTIILSQILFAVLFAMVAGPLALFVSEQLPANVRTSGISLGLNISASVMGGTAPLVATYLVREFKSPCAPSLYLILSALIGLYAIIDNERRMKISLVHCNQDS